GRVQGEAPGGVTGEHEGHATGGVARKCRLFSLSVYFPVVDGPMVMLFLTTPVPPCPRLCLTELVYSPWRIPCSSIGSGTPVLTVNALSIKLDGITPFVSPVLSESPVLRQAV